jgi:WD40 repeat protein
VDVATGNDPAPGTRTYAGHKSKVRTIAISQDGETMVSGDEDGAVFLWDVSTFASAQLQPATGRALASVACSKRWKMGRRG